MTTNLNEVVQRCSDLLHSLSTSIFQRQQRNLFDEDNGKWCGGASKFPEIEDLSTVFTNTWPNEDQLKFAKCLLYFGRQTDVRELGRVFSDLKAICLKIFRCSDSNSAQAVALDTLREIIIRLTSTNRVESFTGSVSSVETDESSMSVDEPAVSSVRSEKSTSSHVRLQIEPSEIASLDKVIQATISQTKKYRSSLTTSLLDLLETLVDNFPAQFDNGCIEYYLRYLINGVLRPQTKEDKYDWSVAAAALRTIATFFKRFPFCLPQPMTEALLLVLIEIIKKTTKTNVYKSTPAKKTAANTGRAKRPNYRQLKDVSAVVVPILYLFADFPTLFGWRLLMSDVLPHVVDCVGRSMWAPSKHLNSAATRALEALCKNTGQLLAQQDSPLPKEERDTALKVHMSCLKTILSEKRARSYHLSVAICGYGFLAPAWLNRNTSDGCSMSMDGSCERVQHSSLVGDVISKLLKVWLKSSNEDLLFPNESTNSNEFQDKSASICSRLLTLVTIVNNLPTIGEPIFSNFLDLFCREIKLVDFGTESNCFLFAKVLTSALEMLDERRLTLESRQLLTCFIRHCYSLDKTHLVFQKIMLALRTEFREIAKFNASGSISLEQRLLAIVTEKLILLLENFHSAGVISESTPNDVSHDGSALCIKINSAVSLLEIMLHEDPEELIPFDQVQAERLLCLTKLTISMETPFLLQYRSCLVHFVSVIFRRFQIFGGNLNQLRCLFEAVFIRVMKLIDDWKLEVFSEQELCHLISCLFAAPSNSFMVGSMENRSLICSNLRHFFDVIDQIEFLSCLNNGSNKGMSETLTIVLDAVDRLTIWIDEIGLEYFMPFQHQIGAYLGKLLSYCSGQKLPTRDEAKIAGLLSRFPSSIVLIAKHDPGQLDFFDAVNVSSGFNSLLLALDRLGLTLPLLNGHAFNISDLMSSLRATDVSRWSSFLGDVLHPQLKSHLSAEVMLDDEKSRAFVDFFLELMRGPQRLGLHKLAIDVLLYVIANQSAGPSKDQANFILKNCLRSFINLSPISSLGPLAKLIGCLSQDQLLIVVDILQRLIASEGENLELSVKSLWLIVELVETFAKVTNGQLISLLLDSIAVTARFGSLKTDPIKAVVRLVISRLSCCLKASVLTDCDQPTPLSLEFRELAKTSVKCVAERLLSEIGNSGRPVVFRFACCDVLKCLSCCQGSGLSSLLIDLPQMALTILDGSPSFENVIISADLLLLSSKANNDSANFQKCLSPFVDLLVNNLESVLDHHYLAQMLQKLSSLMEFLSLSSRTAISQRFKIKIAPALLSDEVFDVSSDYFLSSVFGSLPSEWKTIFVNILGKRIQSDSVSKFMEQQLAALDDDPSRNEDDRLFLRDIRLYSRLVISNCCDNSKWQENQRLVSLVLEWLQLPSTGVHSLQGSAVDDVICSVLTTCSQQDFHCLVNAFVTKSAKEIHSPLFHEIFLASRAAEFSELAIKSFEEKPTKVLRFLIRLFGSASGAINLKCRQLHSSFVPMLSEFSSKIEGVPGGDELLIRLLVSVANANFCLPPDVPLLNLPLWLSSVFIKSCTQEGCRQGELMALNFISTIPLFCDVAALDAGPIRVALGTFFDKMVRLSTETAGQPDSIMLSYGYIASLISQNCNSKWFLRDVMTLTVQNGNWVAAFFDLTTEMVQKVGQQSDHLNLAVYCLNEAINTLATSKPPASSPKLWQSTFHHGFNFCSKLLSSSLGLEIVVKYLEERHSDVPKAVCTLMSVNDGSELGQCCEMVNRGLANMSVLMAVFSSQNAALIASKVPASFRGVAGACFDFRKSSCPKYLAEIFDLWTFVQQKSFSLLVSILATVRKEALEQCALLENPVNSFWTVLVGGSNKTYPRQFGLEPTSLTSTDDGADSVDDSVVEFGSHPAMAAFQLAVQKYCSSLAPLPPKSLAPICPNWLTQIVNRIANSDATNGDNAEAVVRHFLIRLVTSCLPSLVEARFVDFVFEMLAKAIINCDKFMPSERSLPLNYFVVDVFEAVVSVADFDVLTENGSNEDHLQLLIQQLLYSMLARVALLESSISGVQNGGNSVEPKITANSPQFQAKRFLCLRTVDQILIAAKKWSRLFRGRPLMGQFVEVPIRAFSRSESALLTGSICECALMTILALVDNGYVMQTGDAVQLAEKVIWPLLSPPPGFNDTKLPTPVEQRLAIFGNNCPYVLPYHLFVRLVNLPGFLSRISVSECRHTLLSALNTWAGAKPEIFAEILMLLADYATNCQGTETEADCSGLNKLNLVDLLWAEFSHKALSAGTEFKTIQAQCIALEFAASIGALATEIVPRAVELFRKLPHPSMTAVGSQFSPLPWSHLLCACLVTNNKEEISLPTETIELLLKFVLQPAVDSPCPELRLLTYRLVRHLAVQLRQSPSLTASQVRSSLPSSLLSLAFKAFSDKNDHVFDDNLDFWLQFAEMNASDAKSSFQQLGPLSRRLLTTWDVFCSENFPPNSDMVASICACAVLDKATVGATEAKSDSLVDVIKLLYHQRASAFQKTASNMISAPLSASTKRHCHFSFSDYRRLGEKPNSSKFTKNTIRSHLRNDESMAARFIFGALSVELVEAEKQKNGQEMKKNLSVCFDSLLRKLNGSNCSQLHSTLLNAILSIVSLYEIPILDRDIFVRLGLSGVNNCEGVITVLESAGFAQDHHQQSGSTTSLQAPPEKRRRLAIVEKSCADDGSSTLKSLLRLYSAVGDADSVYGIAKLLAPPSSQLVPALQLEAEGSWKSASASYEAVAEELFSSSNDHDNAWQSELVLRGEMSCLARLGDWQQLKNVSHCLVDKELFDPLQPNAVTSMLTKVSADLPSPLLATAHQHQILSKAVLAFQDEGSQLHDAIDVRLKFGGANELSLGQNCFFGLPLAAYYAAIGNKKQATELLSVACHSMLESWLEANPTVSKAATLDSFKVATELAEFFSSIGEYEQGAKVMLHRRYAALSKSTDLSLWNMLVAVRETFDYPTSMCENARLSLKFHRVDALRHQGACDQALSSLEAIYRGDIVTKLRQNSEKKMSSLQFTLSYASTHLSPLRIDRLSSRNPSKAASVLPSVASELLKKKCLALGKLSKENRSEQSSNERARLFYRLLASTLEHAEKLPVDEEEIRAGALRKLVSLFTRERVGCDGVCGDQAQSSYIRICSNLLKEATLLANENDSVEKRMETSLSLLSWTHKHRQDQISNLDVTSFASIVRLYFCNLSECRFLSSRNACLYLPVVFLAAQTYLNKESGLENCKQLLDEFKNGFERLASSVSSPDALLPWLNYFFSNRFSRFFEHLLPGIRIICQRFPHYAAFSLSSLLVQANKGVCSGLVGSAGIILDELWNKVSRKSPATCSFINEVCKINPSDISDDGNLRPDLLSSWFSNWKRNNITQEALFMPWLPDSQVVEFSSNLTSTSGRYPMACCSLRLSNGRFATLAIKSAGNFQNDICCNLLIRSLGSAISSASNDEQNTSRLNLARLIELSCFATTTPLTSSLAIGQWSEEFRSIDTLIFRGKDELKLVKAAGHKIATDFVQKTTGTIINETCEDETLLSVKLAALTGHCDRITTMQTAREALVPSDRLRRSLLSKMTDSVVAHRCRMRLVDSYAVSSLCRYLFGIGDQRLDNTIIALPQKDGSGNFFVVGQCEHLFGRATSNCVVPELVPFRMTEQLRKLLWPCEHGRFDRQITFCIASLLSDQRALVDAMDVSVLLFQQLLHATHNDVRGVTDIDANAENNNNFISERLVTSPCYVFERLISRNQSLVTSGSVEIWCQALKRAIVFDGSIAKAGIRMSPSDMKAEPMSQVISTTECRENDANLFISFLPTYLAPNEVADVLIKMSLNKPILSLCHTDGLSYV